MGEYALLASASESAIALGSCGRVELAGDRLHLFEFVRWGVVPKSRREFDRELGRLLAVGWLVRVRRRHLEFGMAMQPVGDSIGERRLDIECG